jgi:hypothetical protein
MMRPWIAIVGPALLLALAGCGTIEGGAPPVGPPGAVTRASEQGGRFIAFLGPRHQHAPPFLGVPGTNFYALRSWLDTRNGEVLHQLYVEDSYFGAERSYEAARTVAGEALRFVPISKNEITCDNGCSYAEEFGAELPEPLLRASPGGLAVAFTAKTGPPLAITVPGELVQKQLAAVTAARAAPPTPAAKLSLR